MGAGGGDHRVRPLRPRAAGRARTSGPQGFGINFRVRDLDAIVAQLRADGLDVEVDDEVYPNGRFAQLADPEGNAIQLWQEM